MATTKKTTVAKKPVIKKPAAAAKTAAKKEDPKKAALAKKPVTKPDAAKKPAKAKPARKPSAAFMKPLQPDAALAAVIGNKPLPRTEITSKIWAYIKKNNLQDSKNKRMINADDKLKVVFGGKKQVSMFDMTKLVSGHIS